MKPILQLILKIAAIVASISSNLYDTLHTWFNFQGLLAAVVLTLFVVHKHYNAELFDASNNRRQLNSLYRVSILLLTLRHFLTGYTIWLDIADAVFMLGIVIIAEMILDNLKKK